MIPLSQLSFFGLNAILLQNMASSAQMNLALYLAAAVIVFAIVVLIYVYNVLQVVLKTTGIIKTEEALSTGWVNILFVLTIGLGVISIYVYSKMG